MVKGAKGPAGTNGATGPAGTNGPTGPTGPAGATGPAPAGGSPFKFFSHEGLSVDAEKFYDITDADLNKIWVFDRPQSGDMILRLPANFLQTFPLIRGGANGPKLKRTAMVMVMMMPNENDPSWNTGQIRLRFNGVDFFYIQNEFAGGAHTMSFNRRYDTETTSTLVVRLARATTQEPASVLVSIGAPA
jgi:hypothetical protein